MRITWNGTLIVHSEVLIIGHSNSFRLKKIIFQGYGYFEKSTRFRKVSGRIRSDLARLDSWKTFMKHV